MLKTPESYVHPVMVAGEAPHPWVAVWRFRVVMLAVSAVLAMCAIVFVQLLNGNYQGQDPAFEPGGSGLNGPAASPASTPRSTPQGIPRSTPASTPQSTPKGGPAGGDTTGLGGGAN